MTKEEVDLDKKIEELERKKKELKEAKDKKKMIEELQKEVKQYSKSKEIEELGKILKTGKKRWLKFIEEAQKGIIKIQEYNKKRLEEEKKLRDKNTKNLNNKEDYEKS